LVPNFRRASRSRLGPEPDDRAHFSVTA
jgi:hypothetical protein